MQTTSHSGLCVLGLGLCVAVSARAARAENVLPNMNEASAPYASAPQAAPPPRDTADEANQREQERGSEHVRVGVIGGVGFPRPLAIEGMVKFQRLISLGIEYSALPSLTISGVDTSFWALAGDVRIFPGHSAFFFGLRMGRQHLGGSTIAATQYGDFAVNANLNTTFINPRVGFLWTWNPGVTLGIDAGIQIPLANRLTTSLPAGLADEALLSDADRKIVDVAKSFGRSVIPTVDLLRIGFLL